MDVERLENILDANTGRKVDHQSDQGTSGGQGSWGALAFIESCMSGLQSPRLVGKRTANSERWQMTK